MTDFRFTPVTRVLPSSVPFVGPEAQERQHGKVFDARLGANENAFGPSPLAIRAMSETDQWMYGDPESYDLRQALARNLECSIENIVVGEGIDALLGYLVRLFIEPGDAVVTSDGAYPTFNYHVAGFGGKLFKVPYRNDFEDPAALFAKARETDAKLVYLANPDNPMGTAHSGEAIAKALSELPETSVLILDEAYVECAPPGTELPLPVQDPRVIRMRTFSKAYAMAGARVGYAFGNTNLIKAFDKIRNHFGMNRAAQAGALAALEDRAWLGHVQVQIAEARDKIAEIAAGQGLETVPSATNFVAIDCGRDGAFAKAVLDALIERGIFVRMPFVAPQDRCIRVSCGTPEDLERFEAALPQAMAAAKTRCPPILS